ncbi:PQQ-binding-like beta-propeller repeat protein [Fimbriiglobus ruber]|uniref:Putative cell surface protein/ lipoprotein n=1 Tax=Fimbriiglobus ruber TaxID=1908690 RepID=A0A225DZG0_9BACT|nr:PQQ-binding-like beta-propeller repeat protein [Fimbriiglobus ruber]OWK46363.1 putative cell surface protein/ lipoprotein [Fimbriiglobus ruber]
MKPMSRIAAFVSLAVVVIGVVAYLCGLFKPADTPVPNTQPATVWVYEVPHRGGFVAAPWVEGETIYATAVLTRGLRLAGAAYAIDPATGKSRWTFDGDHQMLATASAPVYADGRVYFGEGMHANFVCNLYCLDAATGQKVWTFETSDHVEATPTVADGVVYFGAGNDGVYALDAKTGAKKWQFTAELHVDVSPFVSGGRVYFGSGPSRRYKSFQVVCLNAETGAPVWRVPTDLPAWGGPRVANGRVYVGLGNGRLTEGAKPPEKPAGALLCLSADDGHTLWTVPAADAVFQQPTLDGDRVYFGSRDGNLYAVHADSGAVLYKVPVGGPVISPPAVADGVVYVAAMNGHVRGLAAADGRELWHIDLANKTKTEPLVVAAVRASRGRVYVAAELQTGAGGMATIYCLKP